MTPQKRITKAVIAAAGYGTRFLPATKNQPKEMLPVIDRPAIHYVVEEVVASGITDIILVTRSGQHITEDYFDNNRELEYSLQEAAKHDILQEIRQIPRMANFAYVRQHKHFPYGNATPLLAAQSLLNPDEPFVYIFGDDLALADPPATKQLIDAFTAQQPTAAMITTEVPRSELHRYGVVKYRGGAAYPYEVEELLEKPSAEKAPSSMAVFGRYVLSFDVVREAQKLNLGKDNELWLADILNTFAQQGKKVIAPPVHGKMLTIGDPLNYLETVMRFALARSDFSHKFRGILEKIYKEDARDAS